MTKNDKNNAIFQIKQLSMLCIAKVVSVIALPVGGWLVVWQMRWNLALTPKVVPVLLWYWCHFPFPLQVTAMCPSGIEEQLIIQPGARFPGACRYLHRQSKRLITMTMLPDNRALLVVVAASGRWQKLNKNIKLYFGRCEEARIVNKPK